MPLTFAVLRGLILFCLLALVPAAQAEESMPSALPIAATTQKAPNLSPQDVAQSLSPYLSSFIDPLGNLSFAQILEEEAKGAFLPYTLFSHLQKSGVLWLRFSLAPTPQNTLGNYAGLSLGTQIPARPEVWAKNITGESQLLEPGAEALYFFGNLMDGGDVYIRLEGLPGLWFAPLLISVEQARKNIVDNYFSLTMAALGMLLALCLLRGLMEHGDWRVWAGFFTAAAMLHAYWGIPGTPHGKIIIADMPGIVAAGVALMLLPHIGRHIMGTRQHSPFFDTLLLILALPAAALALLPLLPNMAWTARFLSLWPLGALLCLLPTLILLFRRVQGSGLFLLALLCMSLGSGIALLGIGGDPATPMWHMASLWGVSLASLLIAVAPRPLVLEKGSHKEMAQGLGATMAQVLTPAAQMPILKLRAKPHGALPAAQSHGQIQQSQAMVQGSPSGQALPASDIPSPMVLQKLEEALRIPLGEITKAAFLLDQSLQANDGPLQEEDARQARKYADNMVTASKDLAGRLANIPRILQKGSSSLGKLRHFNLQRMVIRVLDDCRDDAENKGLALSWHIAPHMLLSFRGDEDRLAHVLQALLQDAVRGTDRGSVSVRVRRDDASLNPGHLQFTIVDTGQGKPPLQRNSLALARAWELAADCGGSLFVEHSAQGVEISFTIQLVPLINNEEVSVPPTEVFGPPAAPAFLRVLVVSHNTVNRQMLSFYLAGGEVTVWEARDAEEAVALYSHSPASLVLFDGELPEEDIAHALASIRALEGEYSLPHVTVLALVSEAEQGERLYLVGCDHILPRQSSRSQLRSSVMALLTKDKAEERPKRAKTNPKQVKATQMTLPDLFPSQVQPEQAQLDKLLQEKLQQEEAKQEEAKQAALRQEAELQEALHQQEIKQEEARQAELRQEARRLAEEIQAAELLKMEEELQEAQKKELQRQETLRQETLKQEAQKQEERRQEALRRVTSVGMPRPALPDEKLEVVEEIGQAPQSPKPLSGIKLPPSRILSSENDAPTRQAAAVAKPMLADPASAVSRIAESPAQASPPKKRSLFGFLFRTKEMPEFRFEKSRGSDDWVGEPVPATQYEEAPTKRSVDLSKAATMAGTSSLPPSLNTPVQYNYDDDDTNNIESVGEAIPAPSLAALERGYPPESIFEAALPQAVAAQREELAPEEAKRETVQPEEDQKESVLTAENQPKPDQNPNSKLAFFDIPLPFVPDVLEEQKAPHAPSGLYAHIPHVDLPPASLNYLNLDTAADLPLPFVPDILEVPDVLEVPETAPTRQVFQPLSLGPEPPMSIAVDVPETSASLAPEAKKKKERKSRKKGSVTDKMSYLSLGAEEVIELTDVVDTISTPEPELPEEAENMPLLMTSAAQPTATAELLVHHVKASDPEAPSILAMPELFFSLEHTEEDVKPVEPDLLRQIKQTLVKQVLDTQDWQHLIARTGELMLQAQDLGERSLEDTARLMAEYAHNQDAEALNQILPDLERQMQKMDS